MIGEGKFILLESCGLCLGVLPSVNYEAKKVALNPGDVALLFTDGITESQNKEKEEFSNERLIKLLRKCFDLPAQKLLEKIFDEVNSFTSDVEQMDDMTLVVIKRAS